MKRRKTSTKSQKSNHADVHTTRTTTLDTASIPEMVRRTISEQLAEKSPPLPKMPAQVQFIGNDLLVKALTYDPSTIVVNVNNNRSSTNDRCYYTLPMQLLSLLEKHVPALAEDQKAWQREIDLSNKIGDHSSQVGFYNELPLPFPLLQKSQPVSVPQETRAEMDKLGINSAKVDFQLGKASGYLKRINTNARGYCGWLNTNPKFISERRNLQKAGLQVISLTWHPHADSSGDTITEAARDFLIRWRLMGLAGPNLPEPFRPLMAGSFPVSILSHVMSAGGLFFIPSTFSIPSRDELRDMLESTLRTNSDDHMKEWNAIIHKGNSAKNRIERFARIFELQHYWSVLQQRYKKKLVERSTKLQLAFAKYFKTSEQTVKADMTLIRNRLAKTAT